MPEEQREDPEMAKELELLRELANSAKPLPRGTKTTKESRFYALARKWVPVLLDARGAREGGAS